MNTEWVTVLVSVAASALVSGVVGYLVKRALDKYFSQKDEKEATQRQNDLELERLREEKIRKERKADMEEIVKKEVNPLSAKLDKLSNGTLSSLRNDILTCYYRCREKGYRGDWDYTNIHDLYEAYTELNGNSFIADVMKRFDALPAKEEVEAATNTKIGKGKKRSTTSKKVVAIDVPLMESIKEIKIPEEIKLPEIK